MPGNITIKDENIHLYELEAVSDFDIEALDVDGRAAVDEQNEKFEERILRPALFQRGMPCQCRMQYMVERARRRASILTPQQLGPNGQIPVDIEQEDMDTREFGVIVSAERGVWKSIRMIAVHCKGCGELRFYGDLEPVTLLFANSFNKFDSDAADEQARQEAIQKAIAKQIGDTQDATYVLEDMDTGAMTPADDIIGALTGTTTVESADLKLEEAVPSDGGVIFNPFGDEQRAAAWDKWVQDNPDGTRAEFDEWYEKH